MNLSILRTLTLSLIAAIAPVSLMGQGSIRVTVPFDFTLGSKSFTAGEYRVEHPAPMVLAIRSVNGSTVRLFQAHSGWNSAKPGTNQLTFNRYGDRYFLSQVSQEQRGWELPKSPIEKEIIAKKASPEPIRLAAVARK